MTRDERDLAIAVTGLVAGGLAGWLLGRLSSSEREENAPGGGGPSLSPSWQEPSSAPWPWPAGPSSIPSGGGGEFGGGGGSERY